MLNISIADVIGFIAVTGYTLFVYQIGRNDQRRSDAKSGEARRAGGTVTYTVTNSPTVTTWSSGMTSRMGGYDPGHNQDKPA